LTCVIREAAKKWNKWVEDTMTYDEYAYIRNSQGGAA
jgi:hypothetical protein